MVKKSQWNQGYATERSNFRDIKKANKQMNFSAIKKAKQEKNFTLIDIKNFQLKINPNVCDEEEIGRINLKSNTACDILTLQKSAYFLMYLMYFFFIYSINLLFSLPYRSN